jgi:hypothetical protein
VSNGQIPAVQVIGLLNDEQIRDLVGALLVAGPNVSISVNDAGDAITIAATDTNTTDPEVVRDAIASALVAGPGITITADDAANTITIGTSATTTYWEVVLDGTPPEPVTNADGTDWLYTEVPI